MARVLELPDGEWRRRRRAAADDALSRSPRAQPQRFRLRGALSVSVEHPGVVHGHAGAEGSAAPHRHDHARRSSAPIARGCCIRSTRRPRFAKVAFAVSAPEYAIEPMHRGAVVADELAANLIRRALESDAADHRSAKAMPISIPSSPRASRSAREMMQVLRPRDDEPWAFGLHQMFVAARVDGRRDRALRGDRPLRHAGAEQHAAARARGPRDGQGQRDPRPDSGVGGDLRRERAAGADERRGAARAGVALRARSRGTAARRTGTGTSTAVRSKPTSCRPMRALARRRRQVRLPRSRRAQRRRSRRQSEGGADPRRRAIASSDRSCFRATSPTSGRPRSAKRGAGAAPNASPTSASTR